MDTSESRGTKRRVRPTYKQTEAAARSELEATQLALEQAREEKKTLEANGEALEAIVQYTSTLIKVLTDASVDCSLLPSARLAPNPVDYFAHLSVESAWRGDAPRKEWIDLWTSMPASSINKFNCEFLDRLHSSFEYWKWANDDAMKDKVENSIQLAVKLRADIYHTITMKNPKLMLQLFQLAVVPPPSDPQSIGPREIVKRVLRESEFTGEQIDQLREAWGRYCHSRDIVVARMADISSLQALLQQEEEQQQQQKEQPSGGSSGGNSATETVDIRDREKFTLQPEKTRAEDRTSVLTIGKELEQCHIRMITATGELAVTVVGIITWQQFADTNLSLRPYINDVVQWCDLFSEMYLK
jgi:hypothetical protein